MPAPGDDRVSQAHFACRSGDDGERNEAALHAACHAVRSFVQQVRMRAITELLCSDALHITSRDATNDRSQKIQGGGAMKRALTERTEDLRDLLTQLQAWARVG